MENMSMYKTEQKIMIIVDNCDAQTEAAICGMLGVVAVKTEDLE